MPRRKPRSVKRHIPKKPKSTIFEQRLGDAPIEPQYREQMERMAITLDELLNGEATGKDRKMGFLLMVFPYNDHQGRVNYMSNGANREDVIILMKEQIARFEGRMGPEGRA